MIFNWPTFPELINVCNAEAVGIIALDSFASWTPFLSFNSVRQLKEDMTQLPKHIRDVHKTHQTRRNECLSVTFPLPTTAIMSHDNLWIRHRHRDLLVRKNSSAVNVKLIFHYDIFTEDRDVLQTCLHKSIHSRHYHQQTYDNIVIMFF